MRTTARQSADAPPPTYTTIEAAGLMGMAVRSIQLMVDRGELEAWKTSGGHRRISRESVHGWLQRQGREQGKADEKPELPAAATPHGEARPQVLLIEDSKHYQNLMRLLIAQRFPQVDLHVADEGIAGLAMAGRLQPQVMLVDILLPGIDGATLITSLRTHQQFQGSALIVVTSLDEAQRRPYEFALAGVPVVHKPELVTALPPLLEATLESLHSKQRQA